MNIGFIALNMSGAQTVQSAFDTVRGMLSSYGRCDFKLCGSMSQLSPSLSDAFANSDVVVVGVEPSVYCKAKLAILRAMHIKTELSTQVKERLKSPVVMDAQHTAMQCAMPVDSTVFVSQDGMYSGFAIKSGSQHFSLIPLDKLRLDSVVEKGLCSYLEENGIKSEQTDSAAKGEALSCTDRAARSLRLCSQKIYFADTPSCAIVKNLCKDSYVDGAFVFGTHTAKRGTESPRSYIADLARYSIPDGENALGAAISNVFTGTSQEDGEQRYNIYVAVADRSMSRVLRFASQAGETPEELVNTAVEMLMEMIIEKCDGQVQSMREPTAHAAVEPIEEETPEELTRKKGRGIRIIIYTLLALIAAAVVLFVVQGLGNAKQNRENAQQVFAQSANISIYKNTNYQ